MSETLLTLDPTSFEDAATLERFAHTFDPDVFTPYKESPAFDVSVDSMDPRFEYARVRLWSAAHWHELRTSLFLFLDRARLHYGSHTEDRGAAMLNEIVVKPNRIYAITPHMVHSVGPFANGEEVGLLIFTPDGSRPRSKGIYPDDTFYPKPERIYFSNK